jgi:uncharacterized membrane protein
MMLIGGVFIFFSGFLYALFMFALAEVFVLTRDHVVPVTIVAGGLALFLGIANIKDFFFFKKGISLSIPEDKKPKIYKQMRKLIKTPQISSVLIGTIVLAAMVNFYELLCTLGLPMVFTKQLANLSIFEQGTYIFFYNVVYVIPLIIIVLIFVITLGKRKLSQWHGQIMKLETGIMLSSFGIIFLIDHKILENVATPILLLLASLALTALISWIWKKAKGSAFNK